MVHKSQIYLLYVPGTCVMLALGAPTKYLCPCSQRNDCCCCWWKHLAVYAHCGSREWKWMPAEWKLMDDSLKKYSWQSKTRPYVRRVWYAASFQPLLHSICLILSYMLLHLSLSPTHTHRHSLSLTYIPWYVLTHVHMCKYIHSPQQKRDIFSVFQHVTAFVFLSVWTKRLMLNSAYSWPSNHKIVCVCSLMTLQGHKSAESHCETSFLVGKKNTGPHDVSHWFLGVSSEYCHKCLYQL